MCNAILPCIVCSIVTFVITTNILATHYFKMVDGYVEDMTGMTKEFIDAGMGDEEPEGKDQSNKKRRMSLWDIRNE